MDVFEDGPPGFVLILPVAWERKRGIRVAPQI